MVSNPAPSLPTSILPRARPTPAPSSPSRLAHAHITPRSGQYAQRTGNGARGGCMRGRRSRRCSCFCTRRRRRLFLILSALWIASRAAVRSTGVACVIPSNVASVYDMIVVVRTCTYRNISDYLEIMDRRRRTSSPTALEANDHTEHISSKDSMLFAYLHKITK